MERASLDDLYALDPVEFEQLVGRVFEALGYDVRVTKRSGDQGIDLDLRKGEERSIAQCKRYRGTVGEPAIRDFYGTLVHEKAVRGYFVTSGNFSLSASAWAQGKAISLTDGVDLLSALEESDLLPELHAIASTRQRSLKLEFLAERDLTEAEEAAEQAADDARAAEERAGRDALRAAQQAALKAQWAALERRRHAHVRFRASYNRTVDKHDVQLAHEVEFVQRFAPASVLDVHCGAGQIARALARRGIDVVGLEPQRSRLIAARLASGLRNLWPRHKGGRIVWRNAQAWNADLNRRFDAIVMSNDALLHLALGSHGVAIANMARHLQPGGVLIVGFQRVTDLVTVDEYDGLAAHEDLELVERWSAWDCAPWDSASDYAVLVHRKPKRQTLPVHGATLQNS